MRNIFIAVVCLLIQAICAAEIVTPRIKKIAERSVKAVFKDPESAQFSQLTTFTIGSVLTIFGNLNARNSYGGYSGQQRFWASGGAPLLENVRLASDEDTRLSVERLCDEQRMRASSAALDKKLKSEAVAERTAICKANSTTSECIELTRSCEQQFGKAYNSEQQSYLNLCRQQGLDVAKAEFQKTLGATITFENPPSTK